MTISATVTSLGSGFVAANSVNEATVMLARGLISPRAGSVNEVVRRGSRVLEYAGPQLVEISNPAANMLLLKGRRSNPWASLAEFPWLVAGRNDTTWLLPYLPRAKDFSDDGEHWRAGYGPRLRAWSVAGDVCIDQLQRVVRMLSEEPNTRQAVVSLWSPELDLPPHNAPDDGSMALRFKDYPCSNLLYFSVSALGRLDMSVVMRSNDLFWGFSAVNVLNFTMIQQLVAGCLGRRVGTYRHVANNLHVYERHFAAVAAVANNSTDLYEYVKPEPLCSWGAVTSPVGCLEGFTGACRGALAAVTAARDGVTSCLRMDPHTEAWMGDWARFMDLHGRIAIEYPGEGVLENSLSDITRLDWRLAAGAYVLRRYRRQLTPAGVQHISEAIAGDNLRLLQLVTPDTNEEGVDG